MRGRTLVRKAMHKSNVILDHWGILAIFCYLGSLLVIGWLANRVSHESDVKDFYLAGGSLGTVTLFFTLYATQYSGNTLLALPGKAYRNGFASLGVMIAVMGIVVVYSTFAPGPESIGSSTCLYNRRGFYQLALSKHNAAFLGQHCVDFHIN